MFTNPSPTSNPSPPFASGSQSNYQSNYMSGAVNMDSSIPPLSFSPSSSAPPAPVQQQPQANQMSPEQAEEDDDPNKSEAYKLIQ
jgi:hypothetical protein